MVFPVWIFFFFFSILSIIKQRPLLHFTSLHSGRSQTLVCLNLSFFSVFLLFYTIFSQNIFYLFIIVPKLPSITQTATMLHIKSFISLLLLLLPFLHSALALDLAIEVLNAGRNHQVWGYKGKITLDAVPDDDMLISIAKTAAIQMRTAYETDYGDGKMPTAMSAFNDGSTTVWYHSSMKNSSPGANALKQAGRLMAVVEAALAECSGHPNDGNCGEVAVINYYLVDTGAANVPQGAVCKIVTVSIFAGTAAPEVIDPCGSGKPKTGCAKFLNKMGLSNSCVVKRNVLSAGPGPAYHKRAIVVRSTGLRRRAEKIKKIKATVTDKLKVWASCVKKAATGGAAKSGTTKTAGKKTDQKVVAPKVAAGAPKVAAGAPKVAAGAPKVKVAAGAPKAGACILPKKIVNGQCK
ncbi:hypothetical protein DFH27DRAFT_656434 [Peziza echinospora]|nr:hypothetical protein DFH27DRAFT_656434 [Peziza echinospora]